MPAAVLIQLPGRTEKCVSVLIVYPFVLISQTAMCCSTVEDNDDDV